MADLQKRIQTNPFYKDAILILGRANYHMTRPELGGSGGIDLVVYVSDRAQKETTRTFSLPAKMNGLANIQWKKGFQRDIEEMEKAGLRPSRTQFERQTSAEVISLQTAAPPTPPPIQAPAPIPAPVPAPIAEVAVEIPMMEALIKTSVSTLGALMQLNGKIGLKDDHLLDVRIVFAKADLVSVMTDITQSNAEFVEMKPIRPHKHSPPANEGEPTTGRERLVKVFQDAGRPMHIDELYEFGFTKGSIRGHLSHYKDIFVRIDRGTWDLRARHK